MICVAVKGIDRLSEHSSENDFEVEIKEEF